MNDLNSQKLKELFMCLPRDFTVSIYDPDTKTKHTFKKVSVDYTKQEVILEIN